MTFNLNNGGSPSEQAQQKPEILQHYGAASRMEDSANIHQSIQGQKSLQLLGTQTSVVGQNGCEKRSYNASNIDANYLNSLSVINDAVHINDGDFTQEQLFLNQSSDLRIADDQTPLHDYSDSGVFKSDFNLHHGDHARDSDHARDRGMYHSHHHFYEELQNEFPPSGGVSAVNLTSQYADDMSRFMIRLQQIKEEPAIITTDYGCCNDAVLNFGMNENSNANNECSTYSEYHESYKNMADLQRNELSSIDFCSFGANVDGAALISHDDDSGDDTPKPNEYQKAVLQNEALLWSEQIKTEKFDKDQYLYEDQPKRKTSFYSTDIPNKIIEAMKEGDLNLLTFQEKKLSLFQNEENSKEQTAYAEIDNQNFGQYSHKAEYTSCYEGTQNHETEERVKLVIPKHHDLWQNVIGPHTNDRPEGGNIRSQNQNGCRQIAGFTGQNQQFVGSRHQMEDVFMSQYSRQQGETTGNTSNRTSNHYKNEQDGFHVRAVMESQAGQIRDVQYDTRSDMIERRYDTRSDMIERIYDTRSDMIERRYDTRSDMIERRYDTRSDGYNVNNAKQLYMQTNTPQNDVYTGNVVNDNCSEPYAVNNLGQVHDWYHGYEGNYRGKAGTLQEVRSQCHQMEHVGQGQHHQERARHRQHMTESQCHGEGNNV